MALASQLAKLAPARFAREWGQKFVVVMGSVCDLCLDALTYAALARCVDLTSEDGLPFIGADRQIERGPLESSTSYRARLGDAWDAWFWAGCKPALISQLAAHDLDVVHLEVREWVPEYPVITTNWSRFWIIVPEGEHTYTTVIPEHERATLLRIVRQWKSGSTVLANFIFMVSGRLWSYPLDGITWDGAEAAGLTWDSSAALYL